MKTYTIRDVEKGLETYQQLVNHWVTNRVFTPSVRGKSGPGIPLLFSEDDLVYLTLLKMLLSLGLKYFQINEGYLRGTLKKNAVYRIQKWKCECSFSSLHVVSVARSLFGIDPYESIEAEVTGLPVTWVQL